MATSQQIKSNECVQVGTSTSAETLQESVALVKELVAIGLSTIAYLRIKKIPEAAYVDICENGLRLKVFCESSICPKARKLVEWIKGCFDAIEKQYLRQMTLVIEDAKTKRKLEMYSFRFKYSNLGGATLTGMETYPVKTHNSITESYIGMMRTILILSQTLSSLPSDVELSMQLKYYDEVTPENYEPPGFEAESTSTDFIFDPLTIKIGDMQTPHHGVKLRLRCEPSLYGMSQGHESIKGMQDTSTSSSIKGHTQQLQISVSSQHEPKDTLYSHSDSSRSVVKTPTSFDASLRVIDNYRTPKKSSQASIPPTGTVCSLRTAGAQSEANELQYLVRCACDVDADKGLMILCDVCGYWQHAPCFTVIEPSQAPDRHLCHLCADPPSLCTDPRLLLTDTQLVIATCLFRRALVLLYLSNETEVSADSLAEDLGIAKTISDKIIEKLRMENIIKDTDSESVKEIDRVVLEKEALPKFIRSIKETQTPANSQKANSILQFPNSEETCHFSVSNVQNTGSPAEEKENEEPLPVVASKLKRRKRKRKSVEHKTEEFKIENSLSSIRSRRLLNKKIGRS